MKSLQQPLASMAVFATLAGIAHAGEPAPARQNQLRNLVLQDCGSCHGMTLQGGLGSPLRPQDLTHLDTAAISQIVLDGIPGTPMPPWRELLSESDAEWIARSLKAGDVK